MNKTKMIATISKKIENTDILKELILSGVDVFNIKLALVDQDSCSFIVNKIDKINKELKTNVAVMLETKGPKVQIGKFIRGQAYFRKDEKIRIYMNDILGDETKFSVDYNGLIDDVKYDSVIKFVDSTLELEVLDKGEDFLLCKVLMDGTIIDRDFLNAPGCKFNLPFISSFDYDNIKYASRVNADYLALSFIYSVDDVLEVNDMLIEMENDHIAIVSKIENEGALNDLDEIMKISEGIIVSRKLLGTELPIERVPGIQKKIINKCLLEGKISIIEVGMATSEIGDSYSSDAEVSDIANAVLDGTDAVMINSDFDSDEIRSLTLTERIIEASEENIDHLNFLDKASRTEKGDVTGNIASSVADMVNKLKCVAIVAPTISGYTARKMSRFRPKCPIVALSPDVNTVKNLALYFGVYPVLTDNINSLDEVTEKAKDIIINNLETNKGDKIIITGGYPFNKVKHTNLIEIEEL